jgi:hypothetical protein
MTKYTLYIRANCDLQYFLLWKLLIYEHIMQILFSSSEESLFSKFSCDYHRAALDGSGLYKHGAYWEFTTLVYVPPKFVKLSRQLDHAATKHSVM